MPVNQEQCRHLAEEYDALRARLHLLEDALDNVRHGLCVFDSAGKIAFCNRRYSEAIGLPAEKIRPGLPVRDLIAMGMEAGFYPDRTVDQVEEDFWRNLSCEGGVRGQIHRNGRTFVIHPGRTTDGNLVATFEDISPQIAAEAAIRQGEARLNSILDTMPDCVKIFDEAAELVYINSRGLELLEAPNLEALAASGHIPVAPECMPQVIDVHARVIAGESVVWTYELIGMNGTRRHVESHGVPFRLPDGAPAHMSITRDITERKAAEDALRRSEERLRLVHTATGLADFETSSEGISVGSDRFFETCGLPVPADRRISFEEWFDLVHPDDRERLRATVFKALDGETEFGSEFRILRANNGETRWISSRTLVERNAEGRVVRTIGGHLDITDQKEAENALRRSEERLRLVQDATGLADFENQGGAVTHCSDRFFEQVGLPVGDNTILFDDWMDLIYPEDRDKLLRAMDETIADPTSEDFVSEHRIVRRDDGDVRWISCHTKLLRDEDGNVLRMIGAHSDITDRKKAELALRESEQRMRLVQEATGLADFWSGPEAVAHVSDSMVDQLGLPEGTETLPFTELLKYVHPDDREHLRKQIVTSLEAHETFTCEFRIIHGRTGEVRWIHSRTKMDRDENGKAVRSIGAHLDITDRKNAEEALRESEERFRLAAEAAGLGVWDYDPATDSREWSNRLLEIFGLPANIEPNRRLAAERIHPDDRARFRDLLDAARESETSVKFEDSFRIFRANDNVERWITLNCWKTRRLSDRLQRIILTVRDVTEEKTAEERIRWSAMHDALTRLSNRTAFQEKLDLAVAAGATSGLRVGLLLLDLDNFKHVNDTLGHDVGDRLLKMFADRLTAVVRPGDVVARLGGDEFAIIIPEVLDTASIAELSTSIHERLRDPFIDRGRILDCRASIGGALYPRDGTNPEELMKSADMALYAAKSAGRSVTRMFQPVLREDMQRRTNMIHLAREAIQDHRILSYYQPKLDLRSREVLGFEALMRLRAPGGQIHLPERVEAAFEDLEVAAKLSDRMIEHAIADMCGWLDRGLDFGHVAINASAAEFRSDRFAEHVLEQLETSSIPSSMLQLEVTETVFLGRGAEYVHRALEMLSDAGVKIALDDFGTGYASLRHLKQFPVDLIKIDRSFVRDLDSDPGDEAIVRAVINLGRSLGIAVVAEGIEQESQVEWLLREGCTVGQGFLFSPAQPASAVPLLLTSPLPSIPTNAATCLEHAGGRQAAG